MGVAYKHLSCCLADKWDGQGVDDAGEWNGLACLNASQDALCTALLKTVKSNQLLLVEVIQVSNVVYQTVLVENDGNLLSDAVNVHRMTSHKVFNTATYLLTAAPFVGTYPCGLALDTLQ